MSIKKLKKIRLLLTYIVGFIAFIAFLFIPATYTGEKATFYEAFGVGIFLFGLLYIMFSDWMYYNHLIDQGAKIKYESFQKTGLIVVIFMLCTISGAIYNGLYGGQLGILSILVGVPIIYLLIKWIFSKNK